MLFFCFRLFKGSVVGFSRIRLPGFQSYQFVESAHLEVEHYTGNSCRDDIRERHTAPDAIHAAPTLLCKEIRQKEKHRYQNQHLTCHRDEDRRLCHTDRLEECTRNHLSTHQREHTKHDSDGRNRHLNHLRIGSKEAGHLTGIDRYDDKAEGHDERGEHIGELQSTYHTVEESGSDIEADDWLHALTEAHDAHHKQQRYAVHDSIYPP